jgi:hypothetical protein
MFLFLGYLGVELYTCSKLILCVFLMSKGIYALKNIQDTLNKVHRMNIVIYTYIYVYIYIMNNDSHIT